jgi:hypothetical protein
MTACGKKISLKDDFFENLLKMIKIIDYLISPNGLNHKSFANLNEG